MKALIVVVALVAVLAAPVLCFACPPPPAPGYDGGPAGDGPTVSGDGGGFVESADDKDTGATSGDATTGSCTM